MNEHENFKKECIEEINKQKIDRKLKKLTKDWIVKAAEYKYSYHFEWLGRPIIQHPQDMVGLQQLLWNVQPDLIVETGIARGGSLIFSASILELIAQCNGKQNTKVIGIDIDIRKYNLNAIETHPMSKRIEMIQGSSVSQEVINQIKEISKNYKKIFVCLDSNHTHDHVLKELKIYAPLVSKGSYCVVFDTIIEDLPKNINRPWGISNNPKTAVQEYLHQIESNHINDYSGERLKFIIDKEIESRLLITSAPDGFLKRL